MNQLVDAKTKDPQNTTWYLVDTISRLVQFPLQFKLKKSQQRFIFK